MLLVVQIFWYRSQTDTQTVNLITVTLNCTYVGEGCDISVHNKCIIILSKYLLIFSFNWYTNTLEFVVAFLLFRISLSLQNQTNGI